MKSSVCIAVLILNVAVGLSQCCWAESAKGTERVMTQDFRLNSGLGDNGGLPSAQGFTSTGLSAIATLKEGSELLPSSDLGNGVTVEFLGRDPGPICLHNCGEVPEPSSLFLIATALTGIGIRLRSIVSR